MQKTLKVGLIGLGNMGRNHLRVLSMLKGVELAFVADANAEVAAKAGQLNGILGVVDPTPSLLPPVPCYRTSEVPSVVRIVERTKPLQSQTLR
jgi:hypothetical protein